MNEIRINSFNELLEILFADAWNPELCRIRSRYAFRGLSKASYPLATTLIRLGGAYEQLEHHLLRNFKKYGHRDGLESDTVWHWLTIAQHHGLPTRLLDWTYSPMVAMHFATANIEEYDADGAIWAVNYVQAQKMLPDFLKQRLETEGANVFTASMLEECVTNLEDLSRLSTEDYVIFFEPPSINHRIVNQFAFFSVLSDPTATLDQWLAGHPEIWRKIIIPADKKWEIRDKLDQSNITERVLFPGLDGLSKWLRRHYSPREKKGGKLLPILPGGDSPI